MSQEPTMNPDDYAGRDGLLALHEECRTLAERRGAADIAQLSRLMLSRASGLYEKHDVPRIVASALASQSDGVVQLLNLLADAPGHIYPLAAVETLWRIAEGLTVPQGVTFGISYKPYVIDERTRDLAREKLVDLIVEAEHAPELFAIISAMLGEHGVISAMQAEPDETISLPDSPELGAFAQFFLESIRESSIVLTSSLLREFETLIQDVSRETEYQKFLERHPVFVDPLAAEVISQKKLGLEFVTDFVIRRHDYRYVVVEIEKPRDRIFTLKNDFTAEFTHAVGQVLDFQGWVADNIAYAQKGLPLIEGPHGIVIIGRRSEMPASQQAKLRRWVANSRAIEILTYDDILARAKTLYHSLRRTTSPTD
jgi:hypothetical protein